MPMIDDRNGLEVLPEDECVRLLREQGVGRVAVVAGGRPMIFPVNYAVDGRTIVFRTDEGTKLDGVTSGFNAAFEIDGIDPMYHSGWSVLVTGTARPTTNSHDVAALAHLPLRPWAPGEKLHWVRLRPDTITGRRIPK